MQLHNNDDAGVYAGFNRRDVAADRTCAIPFRSIRPTDVDAYLARTPDGRELLACMWAVEALAEGETWVELRDGVRVPAAAGALVTAGANGGGGAAAAAAGTAAAARLRWRPVKRALPLLSAQEYRARYPRRSCALWVNERKTGRRLLGAVQRDGLVDTAPLREHVPPSWRHDELGALVPPTMPPPTR